MTHSLIFLTASLKFVESRNAIYVLDIFFRALISHLVEYRILEKSHHLKERLLLIHIITNDKTIQQNKVHVKINKIHIYIFPLF